MCIIYRTPSFSKANSNHDHNCLGVIPTEVISLLWRLLHTHTGFNSEIHHFPSTPQMVVVNFRCHLPQLNHWNVGGSKWQVFQSVLCTESDFFFLSLLSGRNSTRPVLLCSHQASLPNSFWIRTPHMPGAVQGTLRNPQVL